MSRFEFYREAVTIAQRITHNSKNAPMGDWRWRLVAQNGKIVAEGGEGYRRSTEMVRTIRNNILVPANVQNGTMPVLERSMVMALARVSLDKDGRTLKRRTQAEMERDRAFQGRRF